MIQEKLEIIIITYNRANYLDHTLNKLLNSPFAKCKFTILDNCSTDHTPKICTKYEKLFCHMEIIRHKKNIGGNSNILRAVEISDSIYTWILCDDDSFDFDDCSDIIDEIEAENMDLLIVSSDQYSHGCGKGFKTTSKGLIDLGCNYYHTLSFVPSSIFKTDLFDSECLQKGYFNIYNQYPHFPFINKSVEDDFSIYVSKNEILKVGKNNPPDFSPLFWHISWLNSCSTIKDKKIRRKTIYKFPDEESFLKKIIIVIILDKIRYNNFRKYNQFLSAFLSAFGFSSNLVLLIIIIPLLLIPGFVYKFVQKIYWIIMNKFNKKEKTNETFHEIEDLR